jgi:hypothetical protein
MSTKPINSEYLFLFRCIDWHQSLSAEKIRNSAESEVPIPELNVIRATFRRTRPTAPCAPIHTRGSAIWEWLELGLVLALALSGSVSIGLFLAGAGNM